MAVEFDEDLWFGTHDDSEAERLAAESMAALAGRVHGSRPLPESAQKLIQETGGSAYSADRAIAIIESDASLAARVLRLVNSAGFGLKVRCKTVRHAVSLLGQSRLHSLAAAAGILELFPEQAEGSALILEHSTVVAAFARHLASEWGLSPDEMFTNGFLMDIGQLIMLHEEQDNYGALLGRAAVSGEPLHLLEREAYGFDHAVLAGHVLRAWQIPSPVPKVVAWHHQPARALRAGEQFGARVALLRACDVLATETEKPRELVDYAAIANSESAQYLGLSAARLGILHDELAALRLAVLGRSTVPDTRMSLPPGASIPPGARMSLPPGRPAVPDYNASGPRNLPPVILRCSVCQATSLGESCPRCHAHLCPRHTLGPEQCCPKCEAEWQQRLRTFSGGQGLRRAFFGGLTLLVAMVLFVVIFDRRSLALIIQFLLVGAGISILVAAWSSHRRYALRETFLHDDSKA